MTGEIVVKPLVKGLSTQKMGGGYGGGFITFALPPHGCHIVSPGEDCSIPHIKTVCNTIMVQDTACHLKFRFCDAPCGIGPADQVGNPIYCKVGTSYNGVGDAESRERREDMDCACSSLCTEVGTVRRTLPHIVPDALW